MALSGLVTLLLVLVLILLRLVLFLVRLVMLFFCLSILVYLIVFLNSVRFFGNLDWSSTWKSLFFMPLDRDVIDLSWKVSHGVLYTAERLISFGYNIPSQCFCGYHTENAEHLFFSCPLAKSGLDWIQSLLFLSSPLAPSINVRHVLFGFSTDELLCVPKVFCYLLNVCKYLVWWQRNDFRFRGDRPGAIRLIASMKARLSFYLPLLFKRCHSITRRRMRVPPRSWRCFLCLFFLFEF